ncbi:hypothetical protein ACFLYL_00975 [Chloroflexota bacterium]
MSGDYPVCIDDNEIVFFFLTKDEVLEHSLIHLIGDYAEEYGNILQLNKDHVINTSETSCSS